MKSWFKSKTMIFNLISGLGGVLIGLLQQSPLDPQVVGVVVSIWGAVNVYLRSVTNTAIGSES